MAAQSARGVSSEEETRLFTAAAGSTDLVFRAFPTQGQLGEHVCPFFTCSHLTAFETTEHHKSTSGPKEQQVTGKNGGKKERNQHLRPLLKLNQTRQQPNH